MGGKKRALTDAADAEDGERAVCNFSFQCKRDGITRRLLVQPKITCSESEVPRGAGEDRCRFVCKVSNVWPCYVCVKDKKM